MSISRASDAPVVIVGAGISGLACALRLRSEGVRVLVLEGSGGVGGRVGTDEIDGFLVDRGFQVLLTAYPEVRRVLDLDSLHLGRFESGSLVRRGARFHRLTDPWRRPLAALGSIGAPIGTLRDKMLVLRLRQRALEGTLDDLFHRPDRGTLQALRDAGFSDGMIEAFLRPFLSGIFLERELTTSSRMLDFVFRMFALGDAALPARGMRAIPEQMASSLERGTVRLRAPVAEAAPRGVRLATGEEIPASAVVVATDGAEAARLVPGLSAPAWRSTVCLSFDAPEAPIREPILVLDGNGSGPVNHLCVPSQVAPTYAPPGRALVSASLVGDPGDSDDSIERAVRAQMEGWFGAPARSWRLLRIQRVPRALPAQDPSFLEPPERPVRLENGTFVCGDHRDQGSLQGAMVSGRRAAEAVLSDLAAMPGL
jgi:phytoene dehydrogenase-like protein